MKAPYFNFYVSDWLSDTRVRGLDLEAKGAFIELLSHMWALNQNCSLPNDDKFLTRLLGIRPAKWQKLKAILLEGHTPVLVIKDGRIYSNRLTKEHTKMVNYCTNQKAKINKRWSKQDHNLAKKCDQTGGDNFKNRSKKVQKKQGDDLSKAALNKESDYTAVLPEHIPDAYHSMSNNINKLLLVDTTKLSTCPPQNCADQKTIFMQTLSKYFPEGMLSFARNIKLFRMLKSWSEANVCEADIVATMDALSMAERPITSPMYIEHIVLKFAADRANAYQNARKDRMKPLSKEEHVWENNKRVIAEAIAKANLEVANAVQ